MINELTALNRTMMLSIDVIPVPTDVAVREMQNRLLGVETNVTNLPERCEPYPQKQEHCHHWDGP